MFAVQNPFFLLCPFTSFGQERLAHAGGGGGGGTSLAPLRLPQLVAIQMAARDREPSSRTEWATITGPRNTAAPPEDELFFDFAARHAVEAQANMAIAYETVINQIPVVGEVQNLVDQGFNSLRRVSMQKADEVIALQASRMMSSIGATMLNSLHDHAMPRAVRIVVDNVYGELWPEVKRSLVDSVMLDLGLEFRELRAKQDMHHADPPRGWLKWCAARLIYAMEPYDLTIWGTIRSPLSLFIRLLFLFPLYGVSDVMVILLAAAKYFTDFDEYVAACPPCQGSP